MSEARPAMPNGRILLGPRELLTIMSLVFMAGGGWTVLHAQGQDVERLKTLTASDHDLVTGLERDVKEVASDVDEIKFEQREQKKLLVDILTSVKAPRL